MKFITSNLKKFADAQALFSAFGIALERIELDVPEIQAVTAQEVALQKARFVSQCIDGNFFVEDSSFHVPALSGFPGVYVKYMLETIGVTGLLKLMEGINDRRCYFDSHLYFCDEQLNLRYFSQRREGLSLGASPVQSGIGWSALWDVIVIDDYGCSFESLGAAQKAQLRQRWAVDNGLRQLAQWVVDG